MKNITIELTYKEVSTIRRALCVLTVHDKEQLQRELYTKEAKESFEKEIETCMELLELDGKVYKAWKEALMETWKETA